MHAHKQRQKYSLTRASCIKKKFALKRIGNRVAQFEKCRNFKRIQDAASIFTSVHLSIITGQSRTITILTQKKPSQQSAERTGVSNLL